MTALLELPPSGQELIDVLAAAALGDPFNIASLTNFSMHHVMAISRSLECVREAGHTELRGYCQMTVDAQTHGVREMRTELASEYGVVIDDQIPGQVPEPAIFGLLLVGIAGLGYMRRRRHSRMPVL